MDNPVDCVLEFGTTHGEEIHAEARKEGRTAFLAPDFSCADSRKSAFAIARKGHLALAALVVALVVFHLLQDAVQVVGLGRL